jgi:tripartite-type tricarboxylate transporter receptor subunit TctC
MRFLNHASRAAVLALCAAGAVISASAADAQTPAYPNHTVRMLIPSAPGGASDTFARLLATKLTTLTGQSFVPENVPGAGTMIASEQLAHSPPDGYTILLVTSSHAINAAIHKNLRYDPIKDFGTVSLVATLPDLMLVNPAVPANSVQEFIALAKKQPGKLAAGSAGTGSATHLDAVMFESMAGVDLLNVPYKGGSPAVTALVAGQVQLMFTNPVSSLQLMRSGKLRALGITSSTRLPMLPDVPTIAESGVPGYEAEAWYGVLVPARTPPDIVAALSREVNKVLAMPDVRKQIADYGGIVKGTSPQEFATYMAEDIARWRKLVETTPALQNLD